MVAQSQPYHFLKRFFVQLFLTLIVFAVCSKVCYTVFFEGFLHYDSATSELPYHTNSIIFNSLLKPLYVGALLLLYLPLIFKWKKKIESPFTERLIVAIAAFLLGWELSTSAYNYCLDSAFYADRFLLILLPFLLFRFPSLLPFFIASTLVFRSQFNYPVSGFPLFDKKLLFDILIMFLVYSYLKKHVTGFKVPFLFPVLCIIGGNYFASGLIKVIISPHGYEWLTDNDPSDFYLNMHHLGWLKNISVETSGAIASFLHRYKFVLQLFVLLIELCALFLVSSRRMCLFLLLAFCMVHLGIFAISGAFFWKWMVVNILLFCVVLWGKQGDIFGRKYLPVFIIACCLSFLWLKPFPIGWFDTPLQQYFTFEAEDGSGNRIEIAKADMQPYEQWFLYDDFLYLLNEPALRPGSFGTTDNFRLMSALRKGSCGISQNDHLTTANYYDSVKVEQFERFISMYFSNRNKRLHEDFLLERFSPPKHLYTSHEILGVSKRKIKVVHVIFNKSCTINGLKINQDKKIVNSIVIPL